MANFDQLKQSVAALIRTNGAEEITGQIMQDVLLTIINSISGGYMFGGVAQHNGNVGNPDYNVFYLAGSGAYTGYGGAITIEAGCYGVFRYNGVWTQEVVDIGVRLSGSIVAGETRGVTGDTINTALQTLFDNVMNILDTLTFTYNTPSAQQATKAMLDVMMTPTGGAPHVLTTLTLASATVAAAGLMSAEDKRKVDRMLTDFRSLSLSDTTAAADQATKIVQTLSATLGENPEAITTFTLLAATASKAGLMSAADKSYLDSLPAVLTGINGAISDNLARVLAMMGYYECSTAEGTAAKVVSASGYALTSGGCIRIKMSNANKANNVTLNINSTGAKALYYDGAQASATNTWEAGEVLEVYYDGTQYQCASGGGGGKFATGENVKDTSITNTIEEGSTALPTSGAVYSKFNETIGLSTHLDLSSFTQQLCSLGTNKWYMASSGNQRHIAIPVQASEKYLITSSIGGLYAFVTNLYNPPYSSGSSIPFVSSESARYSLNANTQAEITIPSDAAYLILTTVDGNGNTCSWDVISMRPLGNVKFASGQVLGNIMIDEGLSANAVGIPKTADVYSELTKHGYYNTPMDISGINDAECSLGDTKWYLASSRIQRHKAIPITSGCIYKIKGVSANGTSSVLWATITAAYNPVSNTNINFTSNESSRNTLNSGQEYTFIAPADAAYLILTTVDGSGVSSTWEVTFISELAEIIEGLSKDASTNNVRIPYDASNISFANFYIAPATLSWRSSTTYKGKLIPAEQYRGMRMTATKNGSVLRLAFITAPPVNDAGVNFSIGTTLIDTTNDQVDTYVPQDCNYIYIYTYSNGTDIEPTLVFYGILSQIFIDKFQFATIVDTSSLTEQNCSLGTKTWYLNSSGIQRHIAIPVLAGDVYEIVPDTNAFYGYVTSSYSPPYSSGNAIPYATGTRIMLYGGERRVVVIPDGCSYLILNIVDGNGLRSNWKVYKGTLAKTLQTPHSIAKFRICSWNIGHFALGATSDTRITYSNYSEMRNKWAAKINEMNADIICCAEYNTFVVNAEGDNPPILASATIFEPYQYAYVGKKLGYAQQCIFSPSELFDVNEVDFPVVTQSRYYLVGTLLINNIPVKIVSTHLDWNGDDKRQAQMQKLINDFANEEYVIICADFNVATSDEYDVFASAGYEMANHGYMGDLPTHPAGNAPETYLDNIISKGFKINGIHVLNDAELSDHCAIYADLTMIC